MPVSFFTLATPLRRLPCAFICGSLSNPNPKSIGLDRRGVLAGPIYII